MDRGAACSGLLPSLFLLCHMNFVTSSLFISVSSFVKWKEGCWSELEVGAGTAVCCHHASGVGPWDPGPCSAVGLACRSRLLSPQCRALCQPHVCWMNSCSL